MLACSFSLIKRNFQIFFLSRQKSSKVKESLVHLIFLIPFAVAVKAKFPKPKMPNASWFADNGTEMRGFSRESKTALLSPPPASSLETALLFED